MLIVGITFEKYVHKLRYTLYNIPGDLGLYLTGTGGIDRLLSIFLKSVSLLPHKLRTPNKIQLWWAGTFSMPKLLTFNHLLNRSLAQTFGHRKRSLYNVDNG